MNFQKVFTQATMHYASKTFVIAQVLHSDISGCNTCQILPSKIDGLKYANKDTKHLYLPQMWTSNWMASQIEC